MLQKTALLSGFLSLFPYRPSPIHPSEPSVGPYGPHSTMSLKNPQLFRFDRCEVVEGFSIRLWDVHIEVVVGNDTDGITGNV